MSTPFKSAPTATCDILFLHRTRKKNRYFNELMHQACAEYKCQNQHYHFLPKPKGKVPAISSAQLQECLAKAEQELFNARSGLFVEMIKPFVMWVRKQQIRSMYARLFALLQTARPKLVLIWNGHKYQDYVLKAVNQHFNIPLGFFENGLLPKSTTLDFVGINAQNCVPRDPQFFAGVQVMDTYVWQITGRKYKKPDPAQFVPPARYILVPFQKERDSQILENSPWIRTMPALVQAAQQALESCLDKEIHLIFRPHPSAVTQYPELQKQIQAHPRLHFDSSMPLDKAIQNAEAVLTINSSVGMEAILMAKKVIVLGDAYYKIFGLSVGVHTQSELNRALNQLPEFTVQEPLRSQFIAYLQQKYVVKGDWRMPAAEHFASVKNKIDDHLRASSKSSDGNPLTHD
jgi:capsular polysaccharide export protein